MRRWRQTFPLRDWAPRRARLAAILLPLLAALALGCSAPAADTKAVHGVLLDVRSSSITRVDSLKLRADDGREWTFTGSPDLEKDPEGSPGHLRSHMARVDPVTVFYHQSGDELVATKVQDG